MCQLVVSIMEQNQGKELGNVCKGLWFPVDGLRVVERRG